MTQADFCCIVKLSSELTSQHKDVRSKVIGMGRTFKQWTTATRYKCDVTYLSFSYDPLELSTSVAHLQQLATQTVLLRRRLMQNTRDTGYTLTTRTDYSFVHRQTTNSAERKLNSRNTHQRTHKATVRHAEFDTAEWIAL